MKRGQTPGLRFMAWTTREARTTAVWHGLPPIPCTSGTLITEHWVLIGFMFWPHGHVAYQGHDCRQGWDWMAGWQVPSRGSTRSRSRSLCSFFTLQSRQLSIPLSDFLQGSFSLNGLPPNHRPSSPSFASLGPLDSAGRPTSQPPVKLFGQNSGKSALTHEPP